MINCEVKGVLIFLVYDFFLYFLNKKKLSDVVMERVVEIVNELCYDFKLVFYNCIVVIQLFFKGKIFIINFVCKIQFYVYFECGVFCVFIFFE